MYETRAKGLRGLHTWSLLAVLLLGSVACDSSPSSSVDFSERTLVILYTNDEHGWIEEAPGTEGAAKLMGLWRASEGYEETGDFLILSGGDNWTGPAGSTWFEGESTVDVMNAMGYDGAAIGNHEFDFTVDGLRGLMGTRCRSGYLHADGSPMKMDSVYTVLTTDYLYARTDYNFHLYDQTPYHTGISYHQPTVTYLEFLDTSPADPLDGHLDHTSRR